MGLEKSYFFLFYGIVPVHSSKEKAVPPRKTNAIENKNKNKMKKQVFVLTIFPIKQNELINTLVS